jgi:hypothetical protein
MSRFGLPGALATIALLLMLSVDPDDAPAIVVLTLLMMGTALTCAYDLEAQGALRLSRPPSWHDARLLLLCLPIAWMTFSAVELFLPLYWRHAWQDGGAIARIEWSLALIVFAMPPALVLATAIAPRHAATSRPALWPLGAVLGASLFGWIGGGFAWLVTGRPLIEGSGNALKAAVGSPPALAASALPFGIALQFGWRAFRDRGAPRFDDAGMFAAVVTTTIVATALGLALLLAFVLPVSPVTMAEKPAVLAACLTVPTAAAWLWTLARVQRRTPANAHRAVIAITAMLVAIPVSFFPPLLLRDSRDWAELFLLLTAPFTILACALIVLVVPRLIARTLDPQRA